MLQLGLFSVCGLVNLSAYFLNHTPKQEDREAVNGSPEFFKADI